ncbi:MAG TPA: FRG domain-containing protein [Bellilinea sp.]|nr:FRG domain-containing protein [Bellilinea sp.]
MRRIEPALSPRLQAHTGTEPIGKAAPLPVSSYRELVEATAELAFLNKDNILFFRGQDQDYLNKGGSSTLYPTIYRSDVLSAREVTHRFNVLRRATDRLVREFPEEKIEGMTDIRRKPQIAWSIIQHYGISATPLLDLTQSLMAAASFAQTDNKADTGIVYVLGLPQITNRISYNTEHDLVNVRLLSICPPSAIRPYFQDGYLAGTMDVTTNYDNKTELDFNNRLIAKFVIPNRADFWGRGFHKIPRDLLYPENDPMQELAERIRAAVIDDMQPEDVSAYLTLWDELEADILRLAAEQESRALTAREAIFALLHYDRIDNDLAGKLDEQRRFRGKVAYEADNVSKADVTAGLETLGQLRTELEETARNSQLPLFKAKTAHD